MRQWVGHAICRPQSLDERPQLVHRDTVVAVAAQESSLDELSPGNGARACRLDAKDWLVGLPALVAAFEPVVKRALGQAKEPSRFGFGLHFTVKNGRCAHSSASLARHAHMRADFTCDAAQLPARAGGQSERRPSGLVAVFLRVSGSIDDLGGRHGHQRGRDQFGARGWCAWANRRIL
jgi:hypothetical protein